MALRKEGYWDKHYALELNNYQQDGDEGEVWFGTGLNKRIIDWLLKSLLETRNDQGEVAIVDVGCGNAYTICSLVNKWSEVDVEIQQKHRLTIMGLDYSANSVELAKKITENRGLSDIVTLKQCDFLDRKKLSETCGTTKFDFIIDKGTFDAILLLSSNSTSDQESAISRYKASLYSITKEGTILILASCNYTEEELLQVFAHKSNDEFVHKLITKIETPTLKFGGKQGSQVTCVIIQFLGMKRHELYDHEFA